MKQINLLSALLLLCLYACNNKPYPHTMQVADKLVYSNPDSACLLLEQLRDSITTEPKATQIYYQLLNIKARDKAYITHTSDSLILEVLHYYEDKKDKTHLPDAEPLHAAQKRRLAAACAAGDAEDLHASVSALTM